MAPVPGRLSRYKKNHFRRNARQPPRHAAVPCRIPRRGYISITGGFQPPGEGADQQNKKSTNTLFFPSLTPGVREGKKRTDSIRKILARFTARRLKSTVIEMASILDADYDCDAAEKPFRVADEVRQNKKAGVSSRFSVYSITIANLLFTSSFPNVQQPRSAEQQQSPRRRFRNSVAVNRESDDIVGIASKSQTKVTWKGLVA